jgi:predicted MFS family arabinose efflux permease
VVNRQAVPAGGAEPFGIQCRERAAAGLGGAAIAAGWGWNSLGWIGAVLAMCGLLVPFASRIHIPVSSFAS